MPVWYAGAAVVTAVLPQCRSISGVVALHSGVEEPPCYHRLGDRPIVAASTIVPNWLFIPICLLAAIGAVHLGKGSYRRAKRIGATIARHLLGIVWRWGYEGGNLLIPILSALIAILRWTKA